MTKLCLPLLFLTFFTLFGCESTTNTSNNTKNTSTKVTERPDYALVIHGGAGNGIQPGFTTPEREKAYRDALNTALEIGENILQNGGTAMDAVENTIVYLENNPLFNAGKGSVLTNAGTNELDASFMDGATQNAGAVGGVTLVKNPIRAARAVMEHSPHVFLSGAGANEFSIEQGLDTVPNRYFFTQARLESLQRAQAAEDKQTGAIFKNPDWKYGTVGCAALDKNGNLAAGTSTGGMTNKRWGRIGDAPIIGAGTYADNATCAVSSTGHGEYYIRYAVAFDIAARMKYLKENVQTSADFVIKDWLVEKGGDGGVIALDAQGNVAMSWNTSGMFRGYAKPNERYVGMFSGSSPQ